ncbi:maleylpyruvate isomerase family mycothiol-dependent enzyme [Pseudonocardiaceae bacterium YIM PH 21723]|nr:maleylpyruvate isomerase family mycothiol-dependent enzyme [Pseudonocardiaceae bacterium YIM PH 21723]
MGRDDHRAGRSRVARAGHRAALEARRGDAGLRGRRAAVNAHGEAHTASRVSRTRLHVVEDNEFGSPDDYAEFHQVIREQAAGLRAAALAAGPSAPVPTCPEWTTLDLVRHMAKVHAWSALNATTGDPATRLRAPQPPEDWDLLFPWWDEKLDALLAALDTDPDKPAWSFDPNGNQTVGFWSRRQAHETSIHRLDAEHAASGTETVEFDAEFAADGVDEALSVLMPRSNWSDSTLAGTVLVHAVDVDEAWLVELTPGGPAEAWAVSEVPEEGFEAFIAGSAADVYRAIWRRPNAAITSGDLGLVAGLRMP